MITIAIAAAVLAWNPPMDQCDLEGGGKLTVSIGEVPEVTERGKTCPVAVEISSTAKAGIAGTLAVALEPSWSLEGSAERPLSVPAGGTVREEIRIVPGPRTHGALYPLHIRFRFGAAGAERILHAVRIFETTLAPPPPPDGPLVPGKGGSLPLAAERAVRISWERFGQPRRRMPFGWTGSDKESRLDFSPNIRSDRGGSLPAISVHPPWWSSTGNGAGTMFADYRIQMPGDTPLRFLAAGALRDIGPGEPPSDGVTYRIYAAPAEPPPAGPPADSAFTLLKDLHIAQRVWTPFEADLGKFAGKRIWLRLETHPGPKKDTTCDGAFWGDPRVALGEALGPAKSTGGAPVVKDLGPIQSPGGEIQVRAILQDSRLGELELAGSDGKKLTIRFTGGSRTEIKVDGQVIRAAFHGDVPIESLTATVSGVDRVYAGFGNVLVRPKERFTLGAGGEKLTTRHVGFDIGPWSLVLATDNPPDRLDVGLEGAGSTLHTHGEATFHVVPFLKAAGAPTAVWQAALAYRDAVPMEPGAGVEALAGRLVFDVWGGRYGNGARSIQRAAALGLKGSVLVWHNWQRWGYDYRLPDICPPNPEFGSAEDFKALAEACRANDVLFAPHDNYIDFYPDAEGFDYEDICFDGAGRPVRAWNNEGRKAQSYRFRPDRIMPYVRRNLEIIRRDVAPTAFFIDVFASINAFDFHDVRGGFHPFTETVARWKEVFEHCRKTLGEPAPQISEDGNDWMIGAVDGGQGNFQRVGKALPGGPDPWAVWPVACEDAERIPWFDAVHRERMILHGAGYGSRYAGGEDLKQHGVDSDDYMATEVLAGHPPMAEAIDSPGAIRKGWLLGGLGRALGLRTVATVEFAGGDIHRQRVVYRTALGFQRERVPGQSRCRLVPGAIEVFVNRGREDWIVGGHELPPFGFLVRVGKDILAVRERAGGTVVCLAEEPGARYVEVRGTEALDLEWCEARGAFRFETGEKTHWDLLPLPGSGAFPVKLLPGAIGSATKPVEVRVLRIEGAGRVEGDRIAAEITDKQVTFTTRPGDAGYRIRLGP